MFRHAIVAALAALSLAATAHPALAIVLNWTNPAGGSSIGPTNWNPAQVPAELDILRFNLPDTYVVVFGSTVDSVAAHQVWAGDVSYVISGTHSAAVGFHVAPLAAQTATARIVTGTMRLGWSASVGAGSGATGTLRIGDSGTNVLQNIFGAPPSGPVMNIGGNTVGGGTGELVVFNGGQLDLAGAINVGRSAGGTGTLRVRGADSGVSGLRRSHVFSDSATADCHIGMEGGDGTLEVQDGGYFRIGRDLFLAEETGEDAAITIGGQNVIDSSRVWVKDDLLVVANGSAGVPGGIGTVTLDSLGVLVVDDSTVVGDPDGSTGFITVKPHTRMITKHLILQQPTGGAVDFLGGLLQVNSGTLSTSTNRLTLPGGTSNLAIKTPTLELLNGATASFTGTGALPPLVVGATGHQFVNVRSGSQITANGGSPTLGDQAGSNGRMYVSEGGELHSDKATLVGVNGQGVLYVQDGAGADLAGLNIGTGTGFGSVLIENAGSEFLSTGPVNVGGTVLAAGGTGNFGVHDGAVARLAAPLNAGTVWPGSQFFVSQGGRAELTGILTIRGRLDVNEGLVTGGSIALRDNAWISGRGVVESGILAAVDSTVSIDLTGPLEIGRGDAGGDVLMRGTLNIGTSSLTVHDPNSAVLGNVELAGGELHLPPGGGVIEAGKHIAGDGTISGPVINSGELISVGMDGLRFDGTVFGAGQGLSGDKFVFLDGGGFEGTGNIRARIQADAGSLIRATGNLLMGKVVIDPNGLILRGRIECGNHLVGLESSSQIAIEGEMVLEGAVVLMPPIVGGALVQTGGRVQGFGTIGSSLTVAGAVAPGNSAGVLFVAGRMTFDAGTLEAELGDHAASEWDVLEATGSVVLDGTLDLRRLPSFVAAPGDSFEIIRCDSLTGTFATVTLDGQPLAGQLEIHYGLGRVWVVVPTSPVGVGDATPAPATVPALQLAPLASPGRNAGVELALPTAASVALSVYDVHGRQVGELWNGGLGAGRHRFELSRVPGAGVFFVRAVVSDGAGRRVMNARVVRLR